MPPLVISSKEDLDLVRHTKHIEMLLDTALDDAIEAQEGEAAALITASKFRAEAVWWRGVAIVGLGCALVLAVGMIWMVLR